MMKTHTMLSCLLLALLAMIDVSCVSGDEDRPVRITYPYVAPTERTAAILDGLPKVHAGMSGAEVRSLLGAPDEVNPTYNSIHVKAAKKIGYSFVYVIQRKQEAGSVVEKDEKLVRVHFGLDDRVAKIISVGLKGQTGAVE